MRALAITPQQAALAKWDAPLNIGLVAQSGAVMENGKVLFWAGTATTYDAKGSQNTMATLYDPATGSLTPRNITETAHEMFCPGTARLADGRLLVNGGANNTSTSLYDATTNTWTLGANMNIARGYNASTPLADGSVLTVGASWSGGNVTRASEVYSVASGWRVLNGISTADSTFLTADPNGIGRADAHMWLIPTGNGRVLHAGPSRQMHWLDVAGDGTVSPAGPRGNDTDSMNANAVMFDAGKILAVGGGEAYDSGPAKSSANMIDTTSGNAAVRALAPMAYPRMFANSVVLPNGQVVVVGGQTQSALFSDAFGVLPAELWDPQTETFTVLPAMSVARNYHSVAMLLLDGRVVSAGGAGCNCAGDHLDMQILSPPYLFNADGSAATRPVISAAPAQIGYGTTITVNADASTTAFSLIRMNATTHTVNNDQRRVALPITASSGGSFQLKVPSNPGILLPGKWMLFATNAQGTPSLAKVMLVSNAGAPGLQNPGSASVAPGGSVNLPITASTPAGTLSFTASGLPAGLAINASTGLISGTASASGSFLITVNASNGSQTVSTDFQLTVVAAGSGTGLLGQYFANTTLAGAPALQRTEVPNFDWGTGAPAANLPVDNFSVRWSGQLEAVATGATAISTVSDDGVRVWVGNQLVIDNWTPHGPTTNTAALNLVAGQRYAVTVEYFEASGGASLRLQWQTPGSAAVVPVPAARLYAAATPSTTNLALGKPTTQSNTGFGGDPGRAVDGNTSGNWADNSITATAGNAAQDWWQVDLGASATIDRIQLLNRSDCCSDRLQNFAVFVSATDMTGRTYDQLKADPGVQTRLVGATSTVPGLAIPIGAAGRYVRVQLAGTNVLSLAEVQVFGTTASTPPPAAAPLVIAAPVAVSGSMVSYSPVLPAGAAAAQYSWNFGDGSADTAASPSPATSHAFAAPGVYSVTLTTRAASGGTTTQTFVQAIYPAGATASSRASSSVALEPRSGASARLWVVNADNDSVSVFDTAGNTKLAEVAVGSAPRSIAVAADGRVWVTNKLGSSISMLSPNTLAVVQTVALPRASQPFGIVFSPADGSAFVALEATGQLLKLNGSTGAQTASLGVGDNPRHLAIDATGSALYVSRFISRPLPGEGTATVATADAAGNALGGEVLVVNPSTLALTRTVVLANSTRVDTENSGRGIPNYLGAAAISPDGKSAWVPGKQDNILRGGLRDGQALNFQNSVRSISSRIDLVAGSEDLAGRIDHDNASVASAAVYHPTGAYLFVALETNRQVAVVDATGKRELYRIEVGFAPQGVVVSPDGMKLYVSNFMSRSVSVVDLTPLVSFGLTSAPTVTTLASVATEKLAATVLRGKQLFYDARDTRLARDSYMSCASCHNDAGHDGRTWDFTSLGEGLRNTPALKGRAGIGQGFMHWSANFDEVQDFEGQIRNFAGGTGLMADADFNAGTRSQPLGDRKAGLSADLDALAAYLGSLTSFAPSPYRNADGTLTTAALAGKTVFTASCASCHGGAGFTNSGDASQLKNIGTIKASSGKRLGGTLAGIDIPTLRDVWATAPYLHDGSAASVSAAVSAHNTGTLNATDLANVVAYVQQIGSEEPAAGPSPTNLALGKTATQSSTVVGGVASRAVDGSTDGNWANNSVTHTDANAQAWWQGDLGQSSSIQSVTLFNRTDCCADRLANFYVFVSASDMSTRTLAQLSADTTVAKVQVVSLNGAASINLPLVATGRYVKVQLTGTNNLSLAEVQVTGTPAPAPTTGGLTANYFTNTGLTGTAALARTENVDFAWGTGSPDASIPVDNFSARWTGSLIPPTTGSYNFATVSDDGVRVWINGTLVIDNWMPHGPTTNTANAISLTAGQAASVRIEYFEQTGGATIRWQWQPPGTTTLVAVPATALSAN